MQMKVPASHHRLVSLAIMETFVRYNRVLQHSQHCLPSVLQTFLGDKGIGHPDKVIDKPPLYLYISATDLQCVTVSIDCGRGCCRPAWSTMPLASLARRAHGPMSHFRPLHARETSSCSRCPLTHTAAAELLGIDMHHHQIAWSRAELQHHSSHPMCRPLGRGRAICSAGWRRACGRTCGRC